MFHHTLQRSWALDAAAAALLVTAVTIREVHILPPCTTGAFTFWGSTRGGIYSFTLHQSFAGGNGRFRILSESCQPILQREYAELAHPQLLLIFRAALFSMGRDEFRL